MDMNTIIGFVAIAFGVLTLVLRLFKPQKLGKLKAMQSFWGKNVGGLIHFISYTIVPIAFGSMMLAGLIKF